MGVNPHIIYSPFLGSNVKNFGLSRLGSMLEKSQNCIESGIFSKKKHNGLATRRLPCTVIMMLLEELEKIIWLPPLFKGFQGQLSVTITSIWWRGTFVHWGVISCEWGDFWQGRQFLMKFSMAFKSKINGSKWLRGVVKSHFKIFQGQCFGQFEASPIC